MENNVYINEIFETIDAADEALRYLYDAKESLASARRWGILDISGGTVFSTMFKRKKMSIAQQNMNKAKEALKKFTEELDDIDSLVNLDFKMDDFLSFADYFFDNIFTDLHVQSKITDARNKIDYTINAIETIRSELVEELNNVD